VRRRVRRLLIAALLLVTVAIGLLLAVHAAPVQRWAWQRVAASLEASTGWTVEAARLHLRLWPARLEVEGLEVRPPGERDAPGSLATVERVQAAWRWRELLGAPRRVTSLRLDGVEVDLRRLPSLEAEDESAGGKPADPWSAFELGKLTLGQGTVRGEAGGLELRAAELRVDARLEGREASALVGAGALEVVRAGRVLAVGPLEARLQAEPSAASVALEWQGVAFSGRVDGALFLAAEPVTWSVEGALTSDLAQVAEWWDPALAQGLSPRGALRLAGTAELGSDRVLRYSARHTGEPLQVGGYSIETLSLESEDGEPRARIAGRGWGSVEVVLDTAGNVLVVAGLERAPLAPALALAPRAVADRLPPSPVLSGDARVSVPASFDLEQVMAEVDLTLLWPGGSLHVRGQGGPELVHVDALELALTGGRITAAGDVDRAAERVSARGAVRIDRPTAVLNQVEPWLPEPLPVRVAGGPLEGQFRVDGPWRDPDLDASLTWMHPVLDRLELVAATARVTGRRKRLEAALEVRAAATVTASVSGTVAPERSEVDARWWLQVGDLRELAALVAAEQSFGVSGELRGNGSMVVGGGGWTAQGRVSGQRLAYQAWQVDELDLDLVARPGVVEVKSLAGRAGTASLHGHGVASLDDLDAPLALGLEWRDLDLGALPLSLPASAMASTSGVLELGGSLARPRGELDLEWTATAPGTAVVPRAALRAALVDGTLRVMSTDLATAAGSAQVEARLPLGDVPRPAWLWPDAPRGPLRATLRADRLDSAPLLAALGVGAGAATVETGLRAELSWDLVDPAARAALLELPGLRLVSATETVEAQQTVRLAVSGREVRLEPALLVGPRSRIELGATTFDLDTTQLRSHANVTLEPEISRLLPVPLRVRGPIRVALDLEGPVRSLDGSLSVDHRGGVMTLRDPPVELADLELEASIVDGAVSIDQGQARLNRGRLDFGGGWDRATGQGLVLELEDVAFVLPMGIISRFDGVIAVEPEPERLARVVGDLVLEGGLWEERVDLAGAVLGTGETPVAADDPLHDVILDLTVRGRGGVRVDNNLGRFDLGWDQLHVGGSMANPLLEGEIHIASGGVLALGGRPAKLRRGVVEFTGEPGAEPRIELVTEESFYQRGEGGEFNAELTARKTLAKGLGQALGLENESLQPAEVAVETETDPGSRFLVGRRLSRYVALFLSTDLANPQDRVTTLQLWNLRGLRGLALQGFSESEGGDGAALFERIRWGGSKATGDQALIHRIKLEGRWPVSKRTLKKVSGLEQGQPYDPFVLFVAGLRLERELAARGYHEARVEGRAEGDELPILTFTLEAGPRQEFRFEGDRLPKALRREVISLYQPPPLERDALEIMSDTLARSLAVQGRPYADIDVRRVGAEIVVAVGKDRKVVLEGPVVQGAPEVLAEEIMVALSGPARLDELLSDPDGAATRVRRLARVLGFHHAELRRVWTEPDGAKRSRVLLEVEPGPLEVIGRIQLEGSDPLGLLERESAVLAPGAPLDRYRIDSALASVRRAYRDAGYSEAELRSRVVGGGDGPWVVEISLSLGVKRTVEEIRITGLRHVSERLVRRTLPVAEGDMLTTRAVDQAVVDLAGFAPVERVDAVTRPLGASGSEVEVQVTEKPRWTVGAGYRWNSDAGSQAVLDLRDDNLLGRGLSLNLRASWESDRTYAALLSSLPTVPGGRFSTSFRVDHVREDSESEYLFQVLRVREELNTATLEATYALDDTSRLRAYVSYREYDRASLNFVPDPFDPFGTDPNLMSSSYPLLGLQYVRDHLDNPFDPRSGTYFAADLSGSSESWGSEYEYVRSVLTGSVVHEPLRTWTWQQTLRLGAVENLGDSELPLPTLESGFDYGIRFVAGGETSVRGFSRDSVGPFEVLGERIDPMGGEALFILNQELRIPVWRELRLALFVDVGQVWETWADADADLAVGAGLGLRYATPVGPLWADVAWPVANRGYSPAGARFYFGVGRAF